MISVAEAWQVIRAHVAPFGDECLPVDASVGRVLAQQVIAERAHPPFDRVTMDGAAIRWSDPLPDAYPVTDTQLAGSPPKTLPNSYSAIEIMTGAPLAQGADTVIPVERYRIEEQETGRRLILEAGYAPSQGQFIHKAGSDHDKAAVLLEAGCFIGPVEVAILLSAGLTNVHVRKQPQVTVIATGDELVPAGEPIENHQIRLSNAPAVASLLKRHELASAAVCHLNDNPSVLEQKLADLLQHNDVLILSGGVSKGKADHVPAVLTALGVEKHFHFVAQRPGKPMWFGTSREGTLVFALPGNPVSTLSCARRYVVEALKLAAGIDVSQHIYATLGSDWQFNPPLTAFVPATIESRSNGAFCVHPLSTNTSGDFASLGGTSGIIELPAQQKSFAAGEAFPWFGW
ncbi:MAG: molybdopterin molybdotransferase MoeA [Pseudomonadota bacterium]